MSHDEVLPRTARAGSTVAGRRMHPPDGQRRVPSARLLVWRTLGAVLLVWTLVVGWPHVTGAADVLRGASATRMLLALVCQLGAVALLSLSYRAALATVGARLSVLEAGGVALRASTVSRLLPGGGAAAAVFAIRRLRSGGMDDGPASAGVAINAVVTMGTLLVVVVAVGATSATSSVVPVVSAAGAVALLAAALHRWPPRRRLAAIAARLRGRRALAVLGAAVDTFAEGPFHLRHLVTALVCASAAWILELAALWAAVAGVGHVLPPATVALGIGAANAAAALPHTPGGIGVVEATMTAAYVAAGLDTQVALGGVLAYRAVGFWLPVGLGATLFGLDVVRRRRRTGRRDVGAVAA